MAKEAAVKSKKGGADLISLAGILTAAVGIVGGLMMEGGKVTDLAQLSAGLIVLAGTFGAVMVSTPGRVLKGALKRLAGVFTDPAAPIDDLIAGMVTYATKARKTGLVSLEEEANAVPDPFLRKALTLAVDGADLQEIRNMLELEISLYEHHAEAEAKVFESAGGYAPTIGIIGAVLGLIQVMKNLANIDEVGHGIAVSFVATVYGVGIANLFFLPAACKIKARIHEDVQRRELILEGVSGIIEGLNPKLVKSKLESYSHSAGKKEPEPEPAPKSTRSRQPAQA